MLELLVLYATDNLPSARQALAAGAMPLREAAQSVLKTHCGACHYPEPLAFSSKALNVYDLSQEDWAMTLSERRLKNIVARLKDRRQMSFAELFSTNTEAADR